MSGRHALLLVGLAILSGCVQMCGVDEYGNDTSIVGMGGGGAGGEGGVAGTGGRGGDGGTELTCGFTGESTGDLLWSSTWGDNAFQSAIAVAADVDDNIFVVLGFGGTINLGTGDLVAGLLTSDRAIAKLRPDGTTEWVIHAVFDRGGIDGANVGPDGHLILFGDYGGSPVNQLQLGGQLGMTRSCFVVKLDNADGSVRPGFPVLFQVAPDESCTVGGLAVDRQGRIGASFSSSVDVTVSGNVIAHTDLADMRDDSGFAVLSAEGAYQWGTMYGEAGNQSAASGVAADSQGRWILADGFNEPSLTIAGSTLNLLGTTDSYVAVFDRDGVGLWADNYNVTLHREARVGVGPNDDIFLVLRVDGGGATINLGGPNLIPAGDDDLAILVLDSTFAHVASTIYGDAMEESLGALAVAADGALVVSGDFQGAIDFGGPSVLGPALGSDGFVVKLDASLGFVWQHQFGLGASQDVDEVAFDCSGNVLALGSFFGDVDLGDGVVTSAGLDDVFLVKIAP